MKKGRVLATRSPAYGFKLTEDRKGYVVNQDTMPTVRRIVGMVADDVTLGEVVRTLNNEGTPSPQGGRWAKPVIRNILKNPAYEPHPAEEVAGMVEPEVAAGLERGRSYELWHFDGIPVPIPESGIEREVVLRARANIAGNRAPSNAGRRLWTLSGGIVRCPECGGVLEAHTTHGRTRLYFYYRCRRRHGDGTWACTYTRGLSAEALEERVWQEVSGLMDNEQAIRDAYAEHIDRARRSASKQNMDRLTRTVEDAETERRGFLRLAAQGHMTDAELDGALSETDERRRAAQETLGVARKNEDWAAGLEAMRDLVLWAVRRGLASHEHTPPQRARLYRKMRLRVTPDAEGEGMRLEFAYTGGEGFCEPNNPS